MEVSQRVCEVKRKWKSGVDQNGLETQREERERERRTDRNPKTKQHSEAERDRERQGGDRERETPTHTERKREGETEMERDRERETYRNERKQESISSGRETYRPTATSPPTTGKTSKRTGSGPDGQDVCGTREREETERFLEGLICGEGERARRTPHPKVVECKCVQVTPKG